MKTAEKLKLIKKGELTAEKNIKQFVDKIRKENKKINAVIEINENAVEEARKVDEKIKKKEKVGRLAGLGILVKANINVKGMFCNCASFVLKDYQAGYDASVIFKIKEEDGIILGLTNMDEFACGASGETSAFQPCLNPKNKDLIPGGSSSGSAASVAAGFCDFSLGSDTGGSIRNPASHCGVVGIKPTYGLVSRYGLIDLSMSLDQIGVFGNCAEDVLLLLNVIRGKDEKDSTSYGSENLQIEKFGKIRVGIPKINADKKILAEINKKVREISEKLGWEMKNIELPHINLGIQTYYPIVYTEFFSGTRKFDGRRYGKKIEDACGKEVLRRILGGSEISQAEYHGTYYRRALMAKQLIKKEFENCFASGIDCIIMPTVPKLPHKIGSKISVEDMYNYDTLTVLANLAEIPAISVPCCNVEGIPVGLQILCPRFKEGKMLSVAEKFED